MKTIDRRIYKIRPWTKGTKRCIYCGHFFQAHIVDLWIKTKGEARCYDCDKKLGDSLFDILWENNK